jgi:hypothetical protein
MNKITITVDVNKLTKSKVRQRQYTSQGQPYTAREIKLDIVELKEPKVIKTGDTWRLLKTHFVAEAQTKEERQAKAPTVYVGEGIVFEDIQPQGERHQPGDDFGF